LWEGEITASATKHTAAEAEARVGCRESYKFMDRGEIKYAAR
jgi:hypothetical protein